jgi:hypothetical protein
MDICLPGAPGAPVLNAARAAASRRNGARACWGEGPQPLPGPGARSRGPKTPAGKARSAQNALKHGMRAQQCIVLPGERAAAFEAFEAALLADLAPQGALQTVLAQRIVAASWRLARAERLEAELFCEARLDGASPGLALALAVIRDGRGTGAFATLLRYRGSASAELWRALRTLKALQAEQAARPQPEATPDPAPDPSPEAPKEPEARENPGQARAGAAPTPDRVADPAPSEAAPASDAIHGRAPDARRDAPDRFHASPGSPIEPEGRTNPGETTSLDAHGSAARAA